jgi:hypothetical protein
MFTDIVGYTALMQADERLGLDKRDRYMSTLESQHEAFGGTIVQRLGDGSMSMFPSSLAAVHAAVAMQRELAAQEVPVRIGVHVRADSTWPGSRQRLRCRPERVALSADRERMSEPTMIGRFIARR